MPEHPFLNDSLNIPWSSLRPERVTPDMEAGLAAAQSRLDTIRSLAGQPATALTFANTVLALEESTADLGRGWNWVGHLDSVSNSPALREAYHTILPRMTDFFTGIALDQDLWRVLEAYATSPGAGAISGVERRLLEETLADFRESGAELGTEGKKRLQEINSELAQLTQKYSENVLDSTNAWELVIDEENLLAGLPESAREAAREDALAKGYGSPEAPRWRFTQHYPSVLPVMKYLENEGIRRRVWEGGTTIGHSGDHDNTPLIGRILALRQEKAALIGKAHFPDLVTSRRMARSGQGALAFVEDMHRRVKTAFDAEFAELEAFKATQTGQEISPLEPWEVAYWSEKLRQERYAFDEEALRPYFPLPRVQSGLFEIAEQLFGITIRARSTSYVDPDSGKTTVMAVKGDPAEPVEVWHPEVAFFEVRDHDGGFLGGFYADWHPRESKRGGAWMNSLRTGVPGKDGRFSPHLGLMCGNMSKASGGRPPLMTHNEVETIFHEFGHLIHHLLGRVPFRSLNGTNVAWDFVELPSQIMENWCWERDALNRFARHWETDEVIPDHLYQKMIEARNFQQAMATMRQLGLARMDLEMHLHPDRFSGDDLDNQLAACLRDYTYAYRTRPPSLVRRFSHLFSDATGYASGYYSYKWAEVLEADAFGRFRDEGVLNRQTGMAFRQTILEKGNSEPPEKLFRDFMGRDPDPEALLRRSGLK